METSPRRLRQLCSLHAELALPAESLLQTFGLYGPPGRAGTGVRLASVRAARETCGHMAEAKPEETVGRL